MASTGDTWQLGRRPALDGVRGLAISREWWWPALLAFVPVLFVLVATRGGIGMSPDSDSYAMPYVSGSWEFHPNFPFGLPTLLKLVGVGAGAMVVNLLALWANLLVSYALAREVAGRRVALAVVAWLSVSVATAQVYSMLWSEPLFCLAVNGALLALAQIVRTRQIDGAVLGWLIVLVNIAGTIRWAALFLAPVVALAVLMAARGGWVRRLLAAAGAAAASVASVFAGWSANLLMGREATGNRIPPEFSSAQVLLEVPRSVAGYVQNTLSVWTITELGAVAMIAGVVLVGGWLARDGITWSSVTMLLMWVGIYMASLLASSLSTRIDPVGFRLSAPVLTATVVVVFAAASRMLSRRVCVTVLACHLVWLLGTSAAWAVRPGFERGWLPF